MSRTKKSEDLVFKALADGKRRRMLDLIRDKPMTTGDLCAKFRGVDRCTVMQHLRVLERAGLVIVKREGRQRWNYINPLPIRDIYARWINLYAGGAVDFLAALKEDIE